MRKSLFLTFILCMTTSMISCDKISDLFKPDDEKTKIEDDGNQQVGGEQGENKVDEKNKKYKLKINSHNPNLGKVMIKPSQKYLDEQESSFEPQKDVIVEVNSSTTTEFLGWYDNSNSLVSPDTKYSFKMPNYDYELTAKWDKFIITYNLNGGTNNADNAVEFNSKNNVKLYEAQKNDYIFDGWYTTSNFTGEKISNILGSSLSNITLYAKWRSPIFTDIYNYSINNNKISITSVKSGIKLTNVTIPSSFEIDGTNMSITSIGRLAFHNCKTITSISIPSSITSLGYDAFHDCSSLASINIPSSITTISDGLFYGCQSLTTIELPNSITTVEDSAFYQCYGLASIIIPNSVTSIGEDVFTNCSSLTSITIPNSVTSLGSFAFYGCSSLTSLTLSSNITSLEAKTFGKCNSLTSINFNGTISKWNELSKDYEWKTNSVVSTIHCTDGNVSV